MCGGRDMDRWIFDHRILPWLREHFDIPEGLEQEQKYLAMKRTILLAAEEAKIARARGLLEDSDYQSKRGDVQRNLSIALSITNAGTSAKLQHMPSIFSFQRMAMMLSSR